MTITDLALGGGALAFAIFGVLLLVNPHALQKVGIRADNAEARTEIRAMYGGLELGIAAFLTWSMVRAEWVSAALWFQLLALGTLAAGRLIGIVMERGRVARLLWFFAALEVGAAVFTGWALSAVS